MSAVIEQRSPEWFAARLGKVTASRIADLMATTRSGYGASRANYMSELIIERLTGQPTDSYTNAAMQWGIDHEADAKAAYEFATGNTVEAASFVPHPEIPESGASPDGLIRTTGLVEIKCPNTATHIDFLLSGTIPDKYVKQMQWQLDCTATQECDFASYDPRLPPRMQLKIIRLTSDNALIAKMRDEVRAFLTELHEKLAKLEAAV